jgi:hypothetical protein
MTPRTVNGPPPPNAPGHKWRILAKAGDETVELEDRGVFDELVIDQWLHLEQMDERRWWMRVGDACNTIEILADGRAQVSIDRAMYENRPDPRLAAQSDAKEP